MYLERKSSVNGDINDCLEDKLIREDEHQILEKLCNSALYVSNQYIKSMNKSDNKRKWRIIGNYKEK